MAGIQQAGVVAQLLELRAFRGTGETKLARDVREFMVAFGQHVANKPSVPPDDVVRLRLRLVVEEMFELLSACDAYLGQGGVVERYAKPEVDMVELADALADIDYVIEGTRIAFGIQGTQIADAVHKSNMAKVGGKLDDLALRRPTLDDVFLSLTGHAAEETADTPQEATS